MIIEKITFRNLTSFRGEQTIDFTAEPLRSASLYAITGDTGAGKSTILDAICLALYDDAPRLDAAEKISKDEMDYQKEEETTDLQTTDSRNIMRRGEKDAESIVIFRMPDGSRYEAVWQCRVKRTGTHGSVQRALRQISPSRRDIAAGSTREVQPHINKLVGLEYNQFSRTVMLAQNSFAMFLQAKKKDKSDLLEKLTGTEIYGEISMRIYAQAKAAGEKVTSLQSRIEGMLHDRLSEAELDDLNLALGRQRTLARHLGTQTERQKAQLKWLADKDAAEKNVADLEREHIAAKQALAALRASEVELERYDAVLPIQPLYQETVVRRNDIDTSKAQDDEVVKQLAETRKEQTAAVGALTNCREQTQEANDQLQQRLPVINRGHAITGEINEATKQLQKLQQQHEQAEIQRNDRTKRLADKRAQMEALQAEINTLQSHHDALAVHRSMFEKIDLIKDKLNSLRTETEQNNQDHKQYQEQQNKQRELTASLHTLEQHRQQITERIATLKGELLIHTQTNRGLDGQALNREVSEIRSKMGALRHATNLWQRLAVGYEDLDNQRAKIRRDESHIEQLRRDIAKADIEVTAREEAYQHLNEAYMLSNSENIRSLRRALKEGTACPVCGATHHPYHTETEREREAHGEIGALMDRLEKEYNEAKTALLQKKEERDTLQQRVAQAEGELRAENESLSRLEKMQAADEEEWKNYAYLDHSFKECSSSVAAETRRMMLGLLTDNAQRDIEQAEEDLKKFNYHQDLIATLTKDLETATSALAADQQQYDTLRTDLKIATSNLEVLQQRIVRSDRACEQLYRDLDELVDLSEWYSSWCNNPDNFRMRLNDLLQDWTSTTAKLGEQQRVMAALREEVHTAEENEQEANLRLAAARDDRNAANERLNEKKEELRRLFGAEEPTAEEQRLRDYVAEMQRKQDEAHKAYEAVNTRLNQLEGEHHNLEVSRRLKQEEYRNKMADLSLWMNRFNMHHSPLQYSELESIFSTSHDWKAVREMLDKHREAVTLVDHRLSEARRALLTLQTLPDHPSGTGEETTEALTAALEATTAKLKETNDTVVTMEARLRSHESCIQQAGAQQAALDAARHDAQEWNRLNVLLGSADGKKFRELAQSYTFRYLVDCANRHLRKLSPRYELHTLPGSLVLDVIDRDMFDERRYVSSLSGGETFVVSLALALGLAGLTAGDINIGSLFIDEGFGNLDHESLSLVMDALSNLENSEGRKVGVISHTDQIRQQIQPQIQVVKTAGGRSVLEIR